MKSLVFIALILVAANSYTLWDNWHNVPTTWAPNPSNAVSSTSSLSGWTRNGPYSQQPSGKFNNYTSIYTQYLYFQTANPNIIAICGPKYYLSTETQCQVNPYFKTSAMPTYCQPNYFNHPYMPSVCDNTNLNSPDTPCCYDGTTFEKTMSSKDNYSTPLWWALESLGFPDLFIYLFSWDLFFYLLDDLKIRKRMK